jgi:hypothetical protein
VNQKLMKYELQNVISGKGKVIYGNAIQAVASYLKGSTGVSKLVKESEFFRKQETEILIEYVTSNDPIRLRFFIRPKITKSVRSLLE